MTTTAQGRAWRGTTALLVLLFLVALAPRFYSAQTLGWHWDAPGSFTLVNFDEGGSCRAALDGFPYTPFIGYQTLALASLGGVEPGPDVHGDARAAKAFCHQPDHLLVARGYSAVLGALTVLLLVALTRQLWPAHPGAAWSAGLLLALSGYHISYSHSGTVDAPSTFFIYAFITAMVFALRRGSMPLLLACAPLLAAAVWTKYWVFAPLALVALVPERWWRVVGQGLSGARIAMLLVAVGVLFGALTDRDFRGAGLYPLLGVFYLLVPWRAIRREMIPFWLLVPPAAWAICEIDLVRQYASGYLTSNFGTGYGAIGWHRWPRNLLNLPVLLLVGLGLPGFVFFVVGMARMARAHVEVRPWLCLAPLAAFALFMAFVSPITYYRHYLPLLPVAAMLAAIGFHASGMAGRRVLVALFFAWPALLAVDLVGDYHADPRRELRAWHQAHPEARVFNSFYVNPPPAMARNSRLFRPEYAAGDAEHLRVADYLVLSENWYDTAFANELNGPLVHNLEKLVKTRPDYARFYRAALADEHTYLEVDTTFAVRNVMPELVLHKRWYGTFQLFVGDLVVLRVRQ